MMNDELFALLSQAEYLQESVKGSQKELVQQATQTREDFNRGIERMQGIINTMPEEARKAVLEAFQSDIAEPLQETQNALKGSLERSKATVRSMTYFTGLMATFFCVFIAVFAYFGIDWIISERKVLKAEVARLKYEYSQLDNELSKTAKVVTVEGKSGHYVYIDQSKDIFGLQAGGTVARLPRR